LALGRRAENAQVGQTRRQKQRPKQSQQLPDHMIADRCQGGGGGEVACRSGRAQDKVQMSKRDREEQDMLECGGETQTVRRQKTRGKRQTIDKERLE